MSLSILCMLSSGEWGGLLWPSVPGGWPAARTLQGGLLPPEGSAGAAGPHFPGQQWRRGRGLWYFNRCVCICMHLLVFHSHTLCYEAYPSLYLDHQCKLCFIFLSDSQHAGHLLYYLQPGHSTARKHMEIPHKVSTADSHVDTYCFCWFQIYRHWTNHFVLSCVTTSDQTESEVPVIGGGTPPSRWHQQQPVWQPDGLLQQLCGAGWTD